MRSKPDNALRQDLKRRGAERKGLESARSLPIMTRRRDQPHLRLSAPSPAAPENDDGEGFPPSPRRIRWRILLPGSSGPRLEGLTPRA